MSKSKFSKKTLELKRSLVLSGLALASFVVTGPVNADNTPAKTDLPGDKINTLNPNEGQHKTEEILAGVKRGGFGYAYLDDNAWDPLNPWGPTAAPVSTGGDSGGSVSGGGGGGNDGGFIEGAYYGPGYYNGVYYGGGYYHGGFHGGGFHGGGGISVGG